MLEGQTSDCLTEKIIGAAIEVHRELGQGLLESVYEEALCHEFDLQGIKYERQAPADIYYKGKKIKGFKLDLLVEGEVVVELKAVKIPASTVMSQVISYLKATSLRLGLIINFNNRRLVDGVKRISV
jgi:GxxExxY protein